MKFRYIILVFFIAVTSCKKGEKAVFTKKTETLPTYNIDPDKIFSAEDNSLQNADSIHHFLDEFYRTTWEADDLSGGLLVAKGNKIIFEKYRGFANENSQNPITENTPLHVASVSKTLTAMGVMKLVEAGKLKLDDPLTKFFPKFPYPEVTVFTLLSQRSGLPKYEYFIEKIIPAPAQLSKDFLTNKDILDLLIQYKPALYRPTNTGFAYCNTNYALLALIVEEVTKVPFPEAMKAMVFSPLKMENTHVFTRNDIGKSAQSFYYRSPKPFALDKLDLIYGDKNVYTTPRDLLKFSEAMFSPNFLKPELMKLVFEPHSNEKAGQNNYGIGFRMKIFDPENKLTYHNGWWHGSNAVFAHLLKSKVTIVAIGNKYSRKVYSALALSSLFENFPLEEEKLMGETEKPANATANPAAKDSLQTDNAGE